MTWRFHAFCWEMALDWLCQTGEGRKKVGADTNYRCERTGNRCHVLVSIGEHALHGAEGRCGFNAFPGGISVVYWGTFIMPAPCGTVLKAGVRANLFSINIDISIVPFTSCSPSNYFVDLPSFEDADRTMRNLSGRPLHGRPLKLKPCVQKRPRDPRNHSDELQSMRWQRDMRERPYTRELPLAIDMRAADLLAHVKEDRRLFVGCLPRPVDNHSSDLEIREVFQGFRVEAVSKVK
ncbi:hypothetical protein BKA63DRAFT_151319 [Paraphoma chrysanthemicola]|nr:hypothetical protein BKA63DRAFT_151319 [Paraphoma chrysanthemicola]